MHTQNSNPKIIRATLSSYIVLSGVWVLLTIGYLFLSLGSPGKNLESGAIIAGGVSLMWWIWLWGFRITISDEYLEYRDGFFRSSKVKFKEIVDIKNVSIGWDILGRKIRIPRINIILLTGNKALRCREWVMV